LFRVIALLIVNLENEIAGRLEEGAEHIANAVFGSGQAEQLLRLFHQVRI